MPRPRPDSPTPRAQIAAESQAAPAPSPSQARAAGSPGLLRWETPCGPRGRLPPAPSPPTHALRGAHLALAGGTSPPDGAPRWVSCAARAWREGARGVLLHLPLAAADTPGLGELPRRTQIVLRAPRPGAPWPPVDRLPPRSSVLLTLAPGDAWDAALPAAAHDLAALAARTGATAGLLLALVDGDPLGDSAHQTARPPRTSPLEGLRDTLHALAEAAAARRLPVGLAPDAGPPRCLAPPALQRRRRAPHALIHSVRTFGPACATCAWARTCPGVPQGWLRGPGGAQALRPPAAHARNPGAGDRSGATTPRAAPPWRERARRALVGRPDAALELRELLPPALLPPRPCALPWTRLEMSPSGELGPCCADYQAAPARAPRDTPPRVLWKGETMAAFRHALSRGGETPAMCRPSCALRASGVTALGQLTLRGGPAGWVDAQLAAVDDAIAGRLEPSGPPLTLMVAPTTYCNYDCLMCHYGEEGTLDDELGEAYYAHVRALLPTLGRLEAVGGEPMASPAFRRFLQETDFRQAPQLEVALVTNGSYLTPRRIAALGHVPFAALIISLNAARPETYEAVNRGAPFAHIRANLDALLDARRAGRLRADITYSFVILRRNLDEIEDFAAVARRDGVRARFRLPNRNRNGQSVMTSPALMTRALQALERVARARGDLHADDELRGMIRVLRDRLQRGIFEPL